MLHFDRIHAWADRRGSDYVNRFTSFLDQTSFASEREREKEEANARVLQTLMHDRKHSIVHLSNGRWAQKEFGRPDHLKKKRKDCFSRCQVLQRLTTRGFVFVRHVSIPSEEFTRLACLIIKAALISTSRITQIRMPIIDLAETHCDKFSSTT